MGTARSPAAARRRRARAATPTPLLAMLAALAPGVEPRDSRDAALLLLGMTGALRRSGLTGSRVGDLAPTEAGLEIVLRGSKTDQHHQGHTVATPDSGPAEASPIQAWARWMAWLDTDQDGRRGADRRAPRCGDPSAAAAPVVIPAPGSVPARCPTRRSPRSSRPPRGARGSTGRGPSTACGAGSPPTPTPAAPTQSRSCATAGGNPPPPCAATSKKAPASATPTPCTALPFRPETGLGDDPRSR